MASLCNSQGNILPDGTLYLFGETVSTPLLLLDDRNVPGIFFLFVDISIRVPGTFRFRFDLYQLK